MRSWGFINHLSDSINHKSFTYGKPNNDSFQSKIENIQYKACIAITGAIQGTFRERLYQELGLESLENRRLVSKIDIFS